MGAALVNGRESSPVFTVVEADREVGTLSVGCISEDGANSRRVGQKFLPPGQPTSLMIRSA
jgi:hypothetical protein